MITTTIKSEYLKQMKVRIQADAEFEGEKIKRAVRGSQKANFARIGAFVRTAVRRLIRYRKNPDKASAEGSPPFTHGGRRQGGVNFRNSILFHVNADSVAIGPKVRPWSDLGALHEHGGRKKQFVIGDDMAPQMKKKFKLKDKGPIATGKYKRHVKFLAKDKWIYRDPKDGSEVVWVKLKSGRQVIHAQRLYRRAIKAYFGHMGMANYPARPFMGPGLERSRSFIAQYWRNTVTA